MEDSNTELESFRQQWREEVLAKVKSSSTTKPPRTTATGQSSASSHRPPAAPQIASEKDDEVVDESEHFEPRIFQDVEKSGSTVLPITGESFKQGGALELYEKAVERESQGNLGDSLHFYRKALKLDPRVDQKYKNKHFPPSSLASKSTTAYPLGTSSVSPNTQKQSSDTSPLTINELLAGFSNLSIEPVPPATEDTSALPCPIAGLPGEILVHIFCQVAIIDVASFVRLAQVCKHMAFLVATEESIWKRICQDTEIGFAGMHYEWQREVSGDPLEPEVPDFEEPDEAITYSPASAMVSKNIITDGLLHGVYNSSWHLMFRLRPRVRFNGCYISTNNYIRPGQASANQVTWNSPVHIVTYYRYLRFFRDGTLISLLTTSEPMEVVHHLTKELLITHRNKRGAHLPSAMMENALRGRWRLSPVNEHPDVDLKDAEGDLRIETEGTSPKYIYGMDFSLRTASRGAKNNKLTWGDFWSYNKLTDDWAEFTRRNEKALFWSRVKSYGRGE